MAEYRQENKRNSKYSAGERTNCALLNATDICADRTAAGAMSQDPKDV